MAKPFRPLKLTRDLLAEFLTNQEQIRQFENLFAVADTVIDAPDEILVLNIATGSAQSTANDALAQIAAQSQESAVNAALAESKANQALALVDKLTKAVEGLQMNPPPREFKRARYGSFYDTTTQLATVINTATAITFNNTDLSNGVFIGSPASRIVVDSEGIYNFDTSFQLDKTSGGVEEFYIWFRLNGVDVPDSASHIRIQGNNAEIFSSLNYFFNLKANDYIELMFSVSDLSVELKSFVAAPPVPSVPSIILTVSNNIGGVQ
jgi:D-ribose pyranose/furanose isomerase RbsD